MDLYKSSMDAVEEGRKLTRVGVGVAEEDKFESINILVTFDAWSQSGFFPPFLEGIRVFANAVGQVSKSLSPPLIIILQVFICMETIFK